MILADSSIWIDYFKGLNTKNTKILDDYFAEEMIIVGDLVLMEVLQGFRDDKDYLAAKSLLEALEIRELGGHANAIAAAENYRQLRKKGVTVRKTIDVLIASYCISNGLWLLHSDRGFEPFEKHLGLRVV